ncbi:DUF4283 domain-containing protein, partial [Cephalotus follicularis]
RKWGKLGRFTIHIMGNGVFIVMFEHGQARDWVLDNGPWDVWGYHLALRKWSVGMSLTLEDCKTISVWVKLQRVPLQYWTKTGLSYIASVLGKPLYMDACMTNRYALSFSQVCIEMAASSSFPDNITLELEDGSTTGIGVEYPWRPPSCLLCKVFDHANKNCPKVVRREWMPKPEVLVQRKPNDAVGWITVKRKGNREEQALVTTSQEELTPEPQDSGKGLEGQAPTTPVTAQVRSSTSQDKGAFGLAREEDEGNRPTTIRTDTTRALQVGSSSGRKKKEKKGHGGLGVAGLRSSK